MNSKKATTLFTWGIFLVVFSISVGNAIQGSLLTDIIDFYNLKSAGQGSFGSFQSIGGLLGLFLPFLLMKKFKKPTILFLLIVLEAVSLFLIGFEPAYFSFVFLYALYGLSKGLSDSVSSSTLSDLHSGHTLAKYIGIQHGVFGIGGLLMPLAIHQLLSIKTSWNHIYILAASFIALLCLLYWIMQHLAKGQLALPSTAQTINWSDWKTSLSAKRDRLLLAGIFTYSFSQIGYYFWISRYVQVQLHNPSMGQTALAVYWIGTALSRIFVPRFKLPPMYVIFVGNIAAAIVAFVGIWSMSPITVVICSFFSACFNGSSIPLHIYTGCSWHKDVSILTTTLSFFVFYIAQILSPPLVGAVSALTSFPVGMLVSPVTMIFSALFTLPLLKEKI